MDVDVSCRTEHFSVQITVNDVSIPIIRDDEGNYYVESKLTTPVSYHVKTEEWIKDEKESQSWPVTPYQIFIHRFFHPEKVCYFDIRVDGVKVKSCTIEPGMSRKISGFKDKGQVKEFLFSLPRFSKSTDDKLDEERHGKVGIIEIECYDADYLSDAVSGRRELDYVQANKADSSRETGGNYTMSTTKVGRVLYTKESARRVHVWRKTKFLSRATIRYRMGHCLREMGLDVPDYPEMPVRSRRRSTSSPRRVVEPLIIKRERPVFIDLTGDDDDKEEDDDVQFICTKRMKVETVDLISDDEASRDEQQERISNNDAERTSRNDDYDDYMDHSDDDRSSRSNQSGASKNNDDDIPTSSPNDYDNSDHRRSSKATNRSRSSHRSRKKHKDRYRDKYRDNYRPDHTSSKHDSSARESSSYNAPENSAREKNYVGSRLTIESLGEMIFRMRPRAAESIDNVHVGDHDRNDEFVARLAESGSASDQTETDDYVENYSEARRTKEKSASNVDEGSERVESSTIDVTNREDNNVSQTNDVIAVTMSPNRHSALHSSRKDVNKSSNNHVNDSVNNVIPDHDHIINSSIGEYSDSSVTDVGDFDSDHNAAETVARASVDGDESAELESGAMECSMETVDYVGDSEPTSQAVDDLNETIVQVGQDSGFLESSGSDQVPVVVADDTSGPTEDNEEELLQLEDTEAAKTLSNKISDEDILN